MSKILTTFKRLNPGLWLLIGWYLFKGSSRGTQVLIVYTFLMYAFLIYMCVAFAIPNLLISSEVFK